MLSGNDSIRVSRQDHFLVIDWQNGSLYAIYPRMVLTDDALEDVISSLKNMSWMTPELHDKIMAEIPWLRAQIAFDQPVGN